MPGFQIMSIMSSSQNRWRMPPYIADFCCMKARVIVELDGDAHLGREDHDAAREEYLRREGFAVVRFWNSDVFAEENRVVETVLALCQQRTCSTRPPAPASLPGEVAPPSPLPLSPRKAGGRGSHP